MTELPFDPKLIATTETLPGYEIVRALGVVEGYQPYTAPAMSIDGMRKRFTEAMAEAYLDMMHKASAHGAQAIVGVRYEHVPPGGMMVYGTAVTVRRV